LKNGQRDETNSDNNYGSWSKKGSYPEYRALVQANRIWNWSTIYEAWFYLL